jgi:hypothetical protein
VIRSRLLFLSAAAAACFATAAWAAEDHPAVAGPFTILRSYQSSDSTQPAARVMSGNKIGITLTNYGFIGTNFSTFAPSFEYPLGSSHMHMVRGGPWIGAYASDDSGAFIGVSTATEDGSAGSNSAGSGEFSPAGTSVGARSTLPNSRFFDPDAVSELDFISSYSDLPADQRKHHRPLGVVVNQYNFEWSFSDYAHFTIFHYVIHNNGPPLRDVWFGMYDELASGNMRLQSSLPPTGWFSKKLITWVDSLSMLTERYCQSRVYPAQCRFDLVPEIAAVKLLGVKPGNVRDPADKLITLAAWNYAPGDPSRATDTLKYEVMATGQRQSLSPLPDALAPGSGDPVSLLAVGPFPTIFSGDSASVDFAYIGGLTYEELSRRAIVAQRAYDLDYIVPVPPPSPRLKVVARKNALDYYWDNTPEDFVDPTSPIGKDFEGYRVYIGQSRDTLDLVAQIDEVVPPHDSTGFNSWPADCGQVTPPRSMPDTLRLCPPVTIDGVTYHYKYTVQNLRDGFKYFSSVTAYDIGTPDIESLESGISQNETVSVPAPAAGEIAGGGITVFPNPYVVEAAWDRGQQARDHYLWFANLPQRCTIHIYTLSGDLIYATDFDGRSYDGSNARGIYRPGSDLKAVLSGNMFGWDMITRQGQAAATGLYMWAVEDKSTGKRQTGKFLLVKSDRESF